MTVFLHSSRAALVIGAALAATVAHAGKDPVSVSPMVFIAPLAIPPGPGEEAAATDPSAAIAQIARFCRNLSEPGYSLDCVAAELADVAAAMPSTGQYAAAKAELARAANELHALAEANRDTTRPAAVIRRGDDATSRPVVPVAPAAAAATAVAAAAIIDRTQTVLLRSASDSAVPEYTQISAALEPTKVLLRST